MIRRTYNFNLIREYSAPHLRVLGLELKLNSGHHDDIEVFNDSESIYVLSINRQLRYVALDIYDRSNGEHCGDVFIQNPEDTGRAWLVDGKQSGVKVRHLLDYIY